MSFLKGNNKNKISCTEKIHLSNLTCSFNIAETACVAPKYQADFISK